MNHVVAAAAGPVLDQLIFFSTISAEMTRYLSAPPDSCPHVYLILLSVTVSTDKLERWQDNNKTPDNILDILEYSESQNIGGYLGGIAAEKDPFSLRSTIKEYKFVLKAEALNQQLLKKKGGCRFSQTYKITERHLALISFASFCIDMHGLSETLFYFLARATSL